LTNRLVLVRFAQSQDGLAARWLKPAALFLSRRHAMLEVTPAATEQIAEYFKGKEVKPIRIFLNEGG